MLKQMAHLLNRSFPCPTCKSDLPVKISRSLKNPNRPYISCEKPGCNQYFAFLGADGQPQIKTPNFSKRKIPSAETMEKPEANPANVEEFVSSPAFQIAENIRQSRVQLEAIKKIFEDFVVVAKDYAERPKKKAKVEAKKEPKKEEKKEKKEPVAVKKSKKPAKKETKVELELLEDYQQTQEVMSDNE